MENDSAGSPVSELVAFDDATQITFAYYCVKSSKQTDRNGTRRIPFCFKIPFILALSVHPGV